MQCMPRSNRILIDMLSEMHTIDILRFSFRPNFILKSFNSHLFVNIRTKSLTFLGQIASCQGGMN